MALTLLPKEIVIHLLQFTGTYIEELDIDPEVYELRDIMQLYCTCKDFVFLADLCYMVVRKGEWRTIYFTTTLFGKEIGPRYDIVGNTLYGMLYNDSVTCCYLKEYGRDASLIINNKEYIENDQVLLKLCEQVLVQWDNVDCISKHFVFECDTQIQPLLIREHYPSNTYVLDTEQAINTLRLEQLIEHTKYISEGVVMQIFLTSPKDRFIFYTIAKQQKLCATQYGTSVVIGRDTNITHTNEDCDYIITNIPEYTYEFKRITEMLRL